MIDIKTQYQAAIFGDIGDIQPTPEHIKALIDLFSDRALIPNPFYEFGAAGQANRPTRRARIGFTSVNREWEINFRSDRIQITKHAVQPHGANLGGLGEFCSDVSILFDKITSKFEKKANRIALVTNCILEEMTEETLSRVYLKLFNPPKFYEKIPPFEWDWRTASRDGINLTELNEILNIIVTISRASGEFQVRDEVTPFDRVRLGFDINTVPDNKEHRFNAQNIMSFYNQVLKLHNSLSAEVMEFVNE
jgi:hypothetical protein